MKQSKFMSSLESLINIVVGLGVAMTANAIILPLVGFPVTLGQNAIIAAFMTVVSFGRSYVLRRIFEALHIRIPLSPGALAIVAERERQKSVEGWSAEHDLAHKSGELARAGAAYALMPWRRSVGIGVSIASEIDRMKIWPWERAWWKPEGDRRDLVKAGALILAELDRMDAERKRGKA